MPVGTVVRVGCFAPYMLISGDRTGVCTAWGNWSNELPKCAGTGEGIRGNVKPQIGAKSLMSMLKA